MRYQVKRYASNRGVNAKMWYKVVDTFNGGKVLRKSMTSGDDAQRYADERNAQQAQMEARVEARNK